jgi:hypothetical protein
MRQLTTSFCNGLFDTFIHRLSPDTLRTGNMPVDFLELLRLSNNPGLDAVESLPISSIADLQLLFVIPGIALVYSPLRQTRLRKRTERMRVQLIQAHPAA